MNDISIPYGANVATRLLSSIAEAEQKRRKYDVVISL
jgi:hypothetical protein